MTQKELMHHIQVCDFILTETALYLDGHPDDQEALAYYHKHRDMREEYIKQYEEMFGPFTIAGVTSKEKWTWSTTPMPCLPFPFYRPFPWRFLTIF